MGKARAFAEERVQLDEWSGPVSPRYQYKTRIVVAPGPNGATLFYEHEGVYSGGKPTETLDATCVVPAEAYEALWEGLGERGVFSLGDAPLPEEIRTRIGVSVNTLEASRGGQQARIEYTLAGLKKPDGAKKRALIEHVKAWAEPLAAAAKPAAAEPAAAKPAAAKKKPAAAKPAAARPAAAAKKKPAATPAKKPTSR